MKRFLLFTSVGAIGTSAHYMVLIGLISLFDINTVISTSMGFLCGACVNYYLNHQITFKSQHKHRVALPKFLLVSFIGFLINALIMLIGNQIFALHYLLVQILATGIVLLWNFAGNSIWTFKGD